MSLLKWFDLQGCRDLNRTFPGLERNLAYLEANVVFQNENMANLHRDELQYTLLRREK